MVNANELRIGNWVDTPNGKILLTMISDEHHKAGTFGEWEVSLPNLQPIPLTPEILEKCGFVKRKPNKWEFWEHEKMYGNLSLIDEENENSGYEVTDSEDYAIHESPIQSLHQLQNLYFALTGEELIVKL